MSELCLDTCDKFMPSEIPNLIVGVFFTGLYSFFVVVVHSLPEEVATFPLNVAFGKQCLPTGYLFSFACVRRMVTELIKAVLRGKCFFLK